MRVVIFGPTGGTGRRLVERAIAEGHEVTAFVRNPSKLTARHSRLRVVVGDAFDPEKVLEAVAGNEAVICVLGSRQPSNPLKRAIAPTAVATATATMPMITSRVRIVLTSLFAVVNPHCQLRRSGVTPTRPPDPHGS